MPLEYGVNEVGALLDIHQVGRGRVDVKCPYCGSSLLARKGDIKAPHFAHDGPTCMASLSYDDLALPAYDSFNLHLPPKVWEELQNYAANRPTFVHRLIQYGLIGTDIRGRHKLTTRGKLPLGQLTLKEFDGYQQPLIEEKHQRLEALAFEARGTPEANFRLTDLTLYRLQWQRVLKLSLYFLEINHAAGTLHKIGVTMRDINERIAEVQRDVEQHLGNAVIKVLGQWPSRGNVELYFKHRYKDHLYPLGQFTEYFVFPDVKKILTYDLRRLPPKELTPLERDVFNGARNSIEQLNEAERIEALRKERIKEGMSRAKAKGEQIGRPRGTTKQTTEATLKAYLAKPKNARIVYDIEEDHFTIRQIASRHHVSTATVQKVKAAIEELKHISTPGHN